MNATALDKDLMSVGAFSLDQLMELAGLSVSQAGRSSLNASNCQSSLVFDSLPRSSTKQRQKHSSSLWAWQQR